MKAVILAGGLGTRMGELTRELPKPLVRIGGKPILWHVMKHYANHGITEFVICCGYRADLIKDYFLNFRFTTSDITVVTQDGEVTVHSTPEDNWRVTLVDTGHAATTGERLRRVAAYVGPNSFCLTYADGLSDVSIHELLAFHQINKKLVTVTAVKPPTQFGILTLEDGDDRVKALREKPDRSTLGGEWVNGGFYVLEPAALSYIHNDSEIWERDPLERAVRDQELVAYRHEGFWHPMDTRRDHETLEKLWFEDSAPWIVSKASDTKLHGG